MIFLKGYLFARTSRKIISICTINNNINHFNIHTHCVNLQVSVPIYTHELLVLHIILDCI